LRLLLLSVFRIQLNIYLLRSSLTRWVLHPMIQKHFVFVVLIFFCVGIVLVFLWYCNAVQFQFVFDKYDDKPVIKVLIVSASS
jgi:hypothetical protein